MDAFKAFKKKIESKVVGKTLEKPAEAFGSGGWEGLHKMLPDYLAQLGVKPRFLKEEHPKFEEMRHKLNTEPGVIICNHPSMADSPMILSTLKRDDFKIVVAEQVYEGAKGMKAGDISNHFISAAAPISLIRTISRHIDAGGVVLIFPTANDKKNIIKNNGVLCFEPGFGFILKSLKPEQMVYCFNVNTEDVSNIASSRQEIGMASELFIHPALNVNRIKDPQVVRMDETYTQAGAWQTNIEDSFPEDADRLLTEQYQNLFKSS